MASASIEACIGRAKGLSGCQLTARLLKGVVTVIDRIPSVSSALHR